MQDEQNDAVEIPEDFAAYQAFRDAGGDIAGADDGEEARAASEEEKPQSGPADEAGETAEDSDTEDDLQQEEEGEEEEEEEEGEEDKPKKNTRLSKRMSKMAGEIKALKSQLADRGQHPAEEEEEATEEVVSSTDKEGEGEPLKRPMLRDFEDNDETGETAWDQYEKALAAYDDANTERKVQTALQKQAQALELKHAKEASDAAWNKAAGRFPDYNEVLGRGGKMSAAMESILRMDPEEGTAIAYYLGNHPEESTRIAEATLANNAEEWADARARASFELGKISSKLAAAPTDKGKPAPAGPTKNPPRTTPAAPPATKKISTASKPPTLIRGGTAKPKFDVTNEEQATDYGKWEREREAALKRK
jgi:hypothetical protein